MAAEDDHMLLNFDDVVKKQSAVTMRLVNALCAGMATDSQTKTLRLTEQGWVIPESMEAGALQGALEKAMHVR
jgi:hypothetical protein